MSTDITGFLRNRLSPEDFATLMQMVGGGNGNGDDDQLPPGNQPDNRRLREEGETERPQFGQDAAARGVAGRYGVTPLKSWASF